MKSATTTRPVVLSASTLTGDGIRNPQGEDLGSLHEIMLDVESGRISYAVLSFGGVLGLGNKLFAIPWSALTLSTAEHKFILDIPRDRLEKAPGFDKSDWPDFADRTWGEKIHSYYGRTPYWSDLR